MIPGDDCPEDLLRYSSGSSIMKLAEMFDLPPLRQDWDVVVADHSRVDEFLNAYDHAELDEDDRFA